jgi:hypothetical protein
MIEFILGIRTPVVTTRRPASCNTASNASVNFESRSQIRNFALVPASSRSMTRLRPSCTTQAAVGCVVAPRTRTRRVACSITAKMYRRAPVSVRASIKSHARMASAWPRRNAAQVTCPRSGAGSIPCSLKISQTVEAAIFMPRAANSPCTLR